MIEASMPGPAYLRTTLLDMQCISFRTASYPDVAAGAISAFRPPGQKPQSIHLFFGAVAVVKLAVPAEIALCPKVEVVTDRPVGEPFHNCSRVWYWRINSSTTCISSDWRWAGDSGRSCGSSTAWSQCRKACVFLSPPITSYLWPAITWQSV